jgi:hypothetical protein
MNTKKMENYTKTGPPRKGRSERGRREAEKEK